ncbi:MAG: M1 family metallopeptidase [Rhodothermaceae bacterium]|nr:M1 family metallopeptidase [Rhodothermaceae bacterium]
MQQPDPVQAERERIVVPVEIERDLPYTIDIPAGYQDAIRKGTRTLSGTPGPDYWQQYATYDIRARLHPETRTVSGSVRISYNNNSPDTLRSLFLELTQNLHAEGVPRMEPAELTGGINLERVSVQGQTITTTPPGARYSLNGTVMRVIPVRPVAPGSAAELEIEWSFKIPSAGASGRMGHDGDNLFYLGYWYPQMAVYDDVNGWFTDPFLGRAEFYHGFADYNLTIEVPAGWAVMATGDFLNPEEVLASHVLERYKKAINSDEVVSVLGREDFGRAGTRPGSDGILTWKFRAEQVRDVAFSATKASFWDAARTPVGDLNGDGQTDYAIINAFYRETAPLWKESVRYSQHSITFLSEYTGFPYPWPHMTAVEGAGIIGGGMEFPMMTVIGDYNTSGASALYGVTAHELAHMWYPMIASTNERRYTWIDEGTAVFITNEARIDFLQDQYAHQNTMNAYLFFAMTAMEGEMMRWSDFHYSGDAFRTASYPKPSTVLHALRGVLGTDEFNRIYQKFTRSWAHKHPYPWDLFRFVEAETGKEMNWFWRSWYYETWTMDQGIANVIRDQDQTRIFIRDYGKIPMPVDLTITLDDGEEIERRIPVDVWLSGRRDVFIPIPHTNIRSIEIDAAFNFPDINRSNNVWYRN